MTSVLMKVDERKLKKATGYRCIGLSSKTHRNGVHDIHSQPSNKRRIYTHPSSNFISIRPPPYIETKKPCVRVVLGKPPSTIDISREGGEIGQEYTWSLHLREAVGDWEVAFPLQRTVGVRGLRKGWFSLTVGLGRSRWANVGMQEKALGLAQVAYV